jgi:hypothetical protein
MTIAEELAASPAWQRIKALPPLSLSVAQAAHRLGTDEETVQGWARDHPRFCPAIREAGEVRIPADWVEWLRTVAVPD